MRDDFSVGLADETVPACGQFFAQLAEVFDDAVVDHRQTHGRMGMRVVLGRLAVGRPARVADADVAQKRLALKARSKVAQLALGAAALKTAALQRSDAG